MRVHDNDTSSLVPNSRCTSSLRKHQGFVVKDGLCFESQPGSAVKRVVSVTNPLGAKTALPTWVVYEKQVLRYYAEFSQRIHESSIERYRKRYFIILYYLEDGTVSIETDKLDSEGILGGTFLRRQKFEGIYIETLLVGSHVLICGHEYLITGIDRFTADYYASLGISQPSFEPPTSEELKPESSHPGIRYTERSTKRTSQFLSLDRKVCRFFSRMHLKNEIRNFQILLYLADDTVEIREEFAANCGRDEATVWFRRGLLKADGSPWLNHEPNDEGLFNPKVLKIGKTVKLVHQEFKITGTDNFTREWFRTQFGIQLDSDLIDAPVETREKSKEVTPKVNVSANSDAILRFSCRMINQEERRFILSYFVDTNEVSIYEPIIRNSGTLGGRFLEKGTYVSKDSGETLDATKLAVGSEFEILGHRFKVEQVDERTREFLRKQSEEQQPVTHPGPKAPTKPSRVLRTLYETRPGFEKRILKELSFLTHNGRFASITTLMSALENLGHTVEVGELTSSLASLDLKVENDSFDIYSLRAHLKRSCPV